MTKKSLVPELGKKLFTNSEFKVHTTDTSARYS